MIQREKIVKSFGWKLLERCSSQAISLLVTIILARVILPHDFGVIALIIVFIDIANVIIDGGLNTALIQKKNTDETDYSTILYFSMGMATVLYMLLFFLSPLIARFYDNSFLTPIFRVLGVILFFNSFNSIQRAYVAKNMLFDRLFYCSLGATIISGATGIVLAFNGYGVWALVMQQIVFQITLTIIMWFTIQWRPHLIFSISRFQKLFDFGWKVLVTNLIISFYENVRSLVIGKLYSPATLAFFDRGKQMPGLIMLNINSSLQAILLPAFSDIQDERSRVKQMMKRSIELTNFCILPILVGIIVTAEELVTILLTDKWLEAVPFIQIFCIAFMLMPIQSSNMSAIKALGYSGITLKTEMIKKGLETIILIVSFMIGIYAVAWGIVLYNLICIVINLYPCKKILNYGIAEQIRDVLPYVVLSAIMGGIVYAISLAGCPIWLTLNLQIIVGLTVYLMLNAVFRTSCFVYIKDIVSKRIQERRNIIIKQ